MRLQNTERFKKYSHIAFVAVLGLASAVQAEMIPPLPPIPSIPGATTMSPIASIPLPPSMTGITPEKKPDVEKPVVAVVAPPMPGGGDKIAGSVSVSATAVPAIPSVNDTTAIVPPPPGIGGLPLPPIDQAAIGDVSKEGVTKETDSSKDEGILTAPMPPSFTAQLKASPTGIVLPPAPKLPRVHESAEGRAKTWQTKLKPVMQARTIKFNYRRQLLPSTIYKPIYDAENEHLPVAVVGEDYDRWFLESVANNDINATRALLDSGRDPNMVNAEGDTALVVALHYGAYDTARLLLARGANPMLAGMSGRNAYDIQPPQGMPWILPQPMAMR
jgi:hypothetical protein